MLPANPSVRAVAVVLITTAATAVSGAGAASTATGTLDQDPEALRVLAAASLIEALPAVSAAWSARGGMPLELSFDATSRLATQIERGAPGDVFISADRSWMEWLVGAGAVEGGEVREFASNRLALVVGRESALDLSSPEALAASDLERIALAGENVPAGRYAEAALRAAGAWEALRERVIRGSSVVGVAGWVARGEVDAGVVYRSDAVRDQSLQTRFLFADSLHPPIVYLAAPVRAARHGDPARQFVAFLQGAEASDALAGFGFGPGAGTSTARPRQLPAEQWTRPDLGSAIRLSLLVALAATALGLAPAVALGWLLARREFRGKSVLSTLVLVPLVLPPVVTGYLLLSLLGRNGVLGGALAGLGVVIPFSWLGAVLAAVAVGFPLYVLAIRTAFEGIDPRFEKLATTLGERPAGAFRRVALPLALPGIAAGAVLAFARALGEFGATIVLAGNLEGATRTIPLAVYTLLESPGDATGIWLLVGASVALSFGALIGYEVLLGRQRSRLRDHGV